MGILSNFFSASETVDKTVDAVINTGDAIFFTDEEKSIASQKILDWKLKMYAATANASPARRFIAVVVSLLWALLIVVGVIAASWGQEDFAKYVFDILKENVKEPFMLILGFYFLQHVIKGWKNK